MAGWSMAGWSDGVATTFKQVEGGYARRMRAIAASRLMLTVASLSAG
jgi:hypothetical protein